MDLNIDVPDFLEELGVHNVQRRGKEAFYSCPFEGHSHGDTNPSASMNMDTTVFYCFGCGRSGNAVHFLAELESVSPVVAKRMIRERFGDSADLTPTEFLKSIRRTMVYRRGEASPPIQTLPEEELESRIVDWRLVSDTLREAMSDVPEVFRYALERLRWEDLDSWEFGWDPISDTLCFPYRDTNGRLIGLKGRAWQEGAKPKYRVLGDKYDEEPKRYGFPTLDVSRVVFGANRIRGHRAHLVVTEGELNAIASCSHGFEAVGVSGQYMLIDQARIIMSLTGSVTLVYDDLIKALQVAELLDGIRVRLMMPREKDPMEMNSAEFRHQMGHTLSSVSARLL